ncbi:MAG: DUF2147 domain-containing protein [Sphingobacteriales bacterium]|nr:MAG: DUF2147 domain-containing protein [Sphingobacteriales bacterium]
MLRTFSFRVLLLSLLLATVGKIAYAQADPIEGRWFNEEKSAKVHIYKAKDNKFYGKVEWLKVPNRDGKPKIDGRNPDASKRNQPIVGLVILKNFKKSGDNTYEDGTVYDPKNGKNYSCKMTRDGNKLEVRGYVGISMIGRSTTWIKAD